MPPAADHDQVRKTLLVGSIPAGETAEAVALALDELGPRLISIPDGETGSRSQWVATIIDGLRTDPAVVLKRDGGWSNYRDRPHHALRRGARMDPAALDLGYHRAFCESRPVVDALCTQHGMPGAVYQVGVASGFDLALFAFGPVGALRQKKVFNTAAAREISAITKNVGNDVVFQIELPAEMVLVARTPRLLRPVVARWMAAVSVELARMACPGTRFGVHLCFGDLGNRSLLRLRRDCAGAVELANAIVAAWPSSATLEYVPIPLAAGNEQPAMHASYYAPLSKLSLPPSSRLIAGFVHENLSQVQLQQVLELVESAAGRTVDVASACGLGRRDPQVARHIMRASAMLCVTRTGKR